MDATAAAAQKKSGKDGHGRCRTFSMQQAASYPLLRSTSYSCDSRLQALHRKGKWERVSSKKNLTRVGKGWDSQQKLVEDMFTISSRYSTYTQVAVSIAASLSFDQPLHRCASMKNTASIIIMMSET